MNAYNFDTVYGCFVDATKAFDLVSFPKLFTLLLDRGLPVPILRVLLGSWFDMMVCCGSDYQIVIKSKCQQGSLNATGV